MEGVIAAVPTPVDETLLPLREPFLEHCTWLLQNGCNGLNILGSTGEANSLNTVCRKEVMAWAAEVCPKERLMVGTGTPSLQETITLTSHADDLGYPIALVLPPYYYKPVDPAGLGAWFMALHAALGDRNIQVYFYNFPQMTGLTIPVDLIAGLAAQVPERFTGIKDSSGDLDYCNQIVAAVPSMRVFPSSETALRVASSNGYAGCISASVNVTAVLAAQIWKKRTDPPETVCEAMDRQRALLAGPRLISSIKYLVAARSGNEDWKRVLPPFLPLAEEAGKALQESLGRDV